MKAPNVGNNQSVTGWSRHTSELQDKSLLQSHINMLNHRYFGGLQDRQGKLIEPMVCQTGLVLDQLPHATGSVLIHKN